MAGDNFQDNVKLGTDGVLSNDGPAIAVGTAAGAKSIILSNDVGALHVAGNPTGNRTISLPDANGTIVLQSNVLQSISAGTTRITSGEAIFSDANGVSFGIDGQTITASVNAGAGGGAAISAGTQSVSTGTVVFSNSNNVTFGMSGSSRVTASASFPAETPFGVSAGTQSVSTGTLVFSNSNNVSFGMSGSSRVTASIQPGVSAIADGNGSTVTSGVVVFSAVGGNVNFGLNGSTMTAICDFAISAGTQSTDAGTVRFSNSNGVSFGMSGGTRITASVDAIKSISAGTTRITSGEAVFSNSNGVSFGVNGNTVTASVATSLTNINVSAGTTSNNLSALVFSNSNGVTFGLNGSTVTASASPPPAAGIASISAGTTRVTSGEIVFSNSNGVSFGINGQTITATVTPGAAAGIAAVSAGTQVQTSGTLTFGDSNGISFGLSGSSQLTASFNAIKSISAGTTRITSGEVVLSNANGISFGVNGNTITANVINTAEFYDNLVWGATNSGGVGTYAFTGSHRSLFVNAFDDNHGGFPFNLTASTFFMNFSLSGSAATNSLAATSHIYVGIYTRSDGTLSLLNSVSISWGSNANNAGLSTQQAGQRFLPILSSAWSSLPVFEEGSRYYMAWFWSSAGALNQTGNILGFARYSSAQRSGSIGVSQSAATSRGWAPFYGVYSATTGALPTAIPNSDLNKVVASAGFVPHIVMVANTNISQF